MSFRKGHSTIAAAAPQITVRESLDRWLTLQGVGKKASTQGYHREIAKIVRQQWPNLDQRLDDVTHADCVEFTERITHYSGPRYNATIHAIRKIVPAAVSLPSKRIQQADHRLPTPEEFDKLLAALDVAIMGNSGLIVRFLACTGLRINEARNLKWENVASNHIKVPGDVAKNGKPRTIPFIHGTREVVSALRLIATNEYVLPQKTCYRAMRYACHLLGIPRFTHHAFRHLFASRCIQSGVDIPTVAKWLGHCDNGALLLRTYCHLLDEHSVEMAKRVKLGGSMLTSGNTKLPDATKIVMLHSIQPEPAEEVRAAQ